MAVSTVLKKAKSLQKNGRHVAILFKGGRIIEHAYNQTGKTKAVCHVFQYSRDRPHAEFAVILKFIRTRPKRDLRSLSMLVLRWDGVGNPAWSFPCKVCESVIRWFGIRRSYALNASAELVGMQTKLIISRSKVREYLGLPLEK